MADADAPNAPEAGLAPAVAANAPGIVGDAQAAAYAAFAAAEAQMANALAVLAGEAPPDAQPFPPPPGVADIPVGLPPAVVDAPLIDPYDSLLMRAGMNYGTRKAFSKEGYGLMSDLVTLNQKQLESLIDMMNKKHCGKSFQGAIPLGLNLVAEDLEIDIGHKTKTTLKVILHWADLQKSLGLDVNAEDYTDVVGQLARERMDEEEKILEAAKKLTPSKPTTLKDMTKWRSFFENWNSYMSQCRGAAAIPLSYVYRTNKQPETALVGTYVNMDAYLVAQTVLSGSNFEIDNQRVFDEFKEAITTTGPGWSFIKTYNRSKDGRAAILKLKEQAEGTLNESVCRDDAIKILSTTTYNGPSRNWNIDMLLQKFQYVISELVEIDGVALPDGQLVTYLVQALKDPSLSYVNDVQTSGSGASGGSMKGGTGKGASKPTPFKGAVTARSYTPGEWKSLSKDQQEKVRSLRNKKKQGGKPEESERNVDSVARDEPVDTKEVHTSREMEPTSDAAGLQFGRDTCVAGANTVLIGESQKSVTVRPFSSEYSALKNIPIGTVATAYTVPEDGRVVLLIINQALFFGDRLKNTLLTPNQMRDFGIEVDNAPRQYVANSKHSLYVPDSQLRIPLQLRGIFSFLESRKPTQQELDECEHIILTSDVPWEPCSADFARREEEAAKRDRSVSLVDTTGLSTGHAILSAHPYGIRTVAASQRILETFCSLTEVELCETNLADRLIACVNVASDDYCGDGLDGRADLDVYPDSEDFTRVVSVYDGSKEQGGGKHWKEIEQRHHIHRHVTEPHSQWQNRAEGEIREIKKAVRHQLQVSRAPQRLWCFCCEWVSAIRRLTAHDIPALNGRVATELLEGDTPDISEYAQFDCHRK
ncbi:predicted protein [Phaeodactylum tricornutum CCAP 1055/1]|uniref:Uncharacterized protein n=1 Tax=Phaeodactylum tricornutum (strain CCAP 1055/1) TaxID=556484 RepID=B7S3Z5_PHATC|nr:predicted protein [Phaeodactylum tricornutum CCAP 1055/1]EEC42677.1 predicted protein [Phaeodactylum tricornutum CCAP 1055/1]|eukprot:XP_002176285.1 predicted protein [Phaeodactylum tricornutum CCAP 1055/1]